MANTVIQIKRNTTAGVAPSSLAAGELAVNLVDRKLYTANATTVFELSGSSGGANTQVQFNDTGKANGSAAFTFDKGSNTVSVGNSTVNNQLTATSSKLSNSTANITITVPTTTQANGSHYLNGNGSWTVPAGGGGGTPAGSNTWIQYNASGAFGANSLFTFDVASSRLHIGNTTANATANVTAFRLANSTSNIALTIPTTTQSNGSYYLNGNGSWAIPPTGGGGGSNTVYLREYWIANSTVNTTWSTAGTYTVGQIDVYQNGVKLLVGSDVDASTGTDITLTAAAADGDVIEIVGFANVSIIAPAGSLTHVQYNDGGVLGGEAEFIYDSSAKALQVGNSTVAVSAGASGLTVLNTDTTQYYSLYIPETYPTLFIGEALTGSNVAVVLTEVAENKPLALVGNANSNIESTIKNYNTGNNVSAEFVATADNGNDTVNYVTFGINGNNYNQAAYNLGGGKAGYIYASNGAMLVGVLSANDIIFHSNGSATTNEIARFKSTGGLDLVSSELPATPDAGRGTLYVANMAGRYMLSMVGNSGINYQAQPHLGRNRFTMWNVIDGTAAPVGIGMALSNTGAYTARSVATSNVFLSHRRTGLATNTTVGNTVENRGTRAIYFLGNANGVGGFHFFARAGVSGHHATVNMFLGLHTGTGAIGNLQSSNVRSCVGFGVSNTSNNWMVITGNSTATNTINLGSGFPANTVNADMYEFFLFAKPNSATVTYRVTRVNDGNTAFGTCNTTCIIPVNTTMAPKAQITNTTTGTAAGLDIVSLYIESDNSG